MALVDLHLHTTFSDGIVTPREIVKIAAAHGVGTIAVTDHDNIGGLDEAFAAAQHAGVKIVAGTEISTTWHGQSIHLTAYGFNPKDKIFSDFLEGHCEVRKQIFIKKIEAIAPDLVEEFIKYSGSFFNANKTRNFLIESGKFPDLSAVRQAIRGVSVEEIFSSPEETIEAVHRAGGVIVLAHPLAPKISLKLIDASTDGQRKLVAELVGQQLDGIECYQASHAPEDIALALEIAKENDIFVSAGSDWHGPIETLGESVRDYIPFYVDGPGGLKTPEEAVAPLLERLGLPREAEAK